MANLLLITPPFTQLNTPYPATAYIKGFLNTLGVKAVQMDLGLEVILQIFSKKGLTIVFEKATFKQDLSENAQRILVLKNNYLLTIEPVIAFLQGKNPTLAHQIVTESFLPEASRFTVIDDLEWAFGTMGVADKAKHLATLYLEDISDFIVECVDERFGFSRYAEKLGRSANSFDDLYKALNEDKTFIDEITLGILAEKLQQNFYDLVVFSVPFPGNLYSAFRCGQWIKAHFPETEIALGGGFANTELRDLKEVRVFEFFDYVCLDDGEAPLKCLVENLEKEQGDKLYKRTFLLENGTVIYKNDKNIVDFKQSKVGTPDYSDLWLDKYISVIEIANPMHRMWSDGRWNKLTMAHGCYWGKCTFCDISLDYIKLYEPIAAKQIVDRMEELVAQTGQTGFHFVDEAAPPALMKELALEIIRRKVQVTWWTNIRFEKSFTLDLCKLLKESGLVAVSGGLEVASDRLLALIEKGVTVAQVAQVTQNFTKVGTMVHAYLMYGFPTQTIQETVDSLEMVRQLFDLGIVQSGFWHQFALTVHSPVGMYPQKYGVDILNKKIGEFANNDLEYTEKNAVEHDKFSFGLKKSLFNYMHGIGFEEPLQFWFDFKIPKTTIAPNYIEKCIENEGITFYQAHHKLYWLGAKPSLMPNRDTKSNKTSLVFYSKKETSTLKIETKKAAWLINMINEIANENCKDRKMIDWEQRFEDSFGEDLQLFLKNKPINLLFENGLIIV